MADEVTYAHAPEVREIARELVGKYHEHVDKVTVFYVFRSKHAEAAGKIVAGKAKKVSGLNAFLAYNAMVEDGEELMSEAPASFWVIEIARDVWDAFDATKRIALVDHELCHIGPDLSARGHDVEEFSEVIQRWGLWRPDLARLIEAGMPHMKQKELFDAAVSGTYAAGESEESAAMLMTRVNRVLRDRDRGFIDRLWPKTGSITVSVGATSLTLSRCCAAMHDGAGVVHVTCEEHAFAGRYQPRNQPPVHCPSARRSNLRLRTEVRTMNDEVNPEVMKEIALVEKITGTTPEEKKEIPTPTFSKPALALNALSYIRLTPENGEQVAALVKQLFTYAPWNGDQITDGAIINEHLQASYMSILRNAPPSPMRTKALGAIVEARLFVNTAITFGGQV